MKRTKFDAPAPIVKPITVDVNAVWNKKRKVSDELRARVLQAVKSEKELQNS